MSYEGWMALGSLVIAIAVGISGIVRGRSEMRKFGADTYTSYQEALQKAQESYDRLSDRFDELEQKYNNMVVWNKALVNQLMDNRIVPVSLEKAILMNKNGQA